MAGFAAGFAKGFIDESTRLDEARKERQKLEYLTQQENAKLDKMFEQDKAKMYLQDSFSRRNEYEELDRKNKSLMRSAKSLNEQYGIPLDVAVEGLQGGMSMEKMIQLSTSGNWLPTVSGVSQPTQVQTEQAAPTTSSMNSGPAPSGGPTNDRSLDFVDGSQAFSKNPAQSAASAGPGNSGINTGATTQNREQAQMTSRQPSETQSANEATRYTYRPNSDVEKLPKTKEEMAAYIARARSSGDPSQIEMANNMKAAYLDIASAEKTIADGNKADYGLYRSEDGETKVVAVAKVWNESTARTEYKDLNTGEIVDSRNFIPYSDDQKKLAEEVRKLGTNKTVIDYQQNLGKIQTAYSMFNKMNDQLVADPNVLADVVGRGAMGLNQLSREASALFGLAKGEAKAINLNSMSPEEIDQLEQKVKSIDLGAVTSFAERKALWEATVKLAVYRIGSLEGQEGRALTNQDMENFEKIIRNSETPEAFRQNMRNYLSIAKERVEAQGTIVNQYNSTLEEYNRATGGNVPGDLKTLAPTVDEFILNEGSESARAGYSLSQAQEQPLNQTTSPLEDMPQIQVPAGAIKKLKENPELRDYFDKKYGEGAAAQVLGE